MQIFAGEIAKWLKLSLFNSDSTKKTDIILYANIAGSFSNEEDIAVMIPCWQNIPYRVVLIGAVAKIRWLLSSNCAKLVSINDGRERSNSLTAIAR